MKNHKLYGGKSQKNNIDQLSYCSETIYDILIEILILVKVLTILLVIELLKLIR